MYKEVLLQTGKEANVAFRHPWIFSGALAAIPEGLEHGDLVKVKDKYGKTLGTGTYSNKGSIAVRVFEFGDAELDRAWMVKRFESAKRRRELLRFGTETQTTGYRMLFGEADGFPGLVIDRYENIYVFQIATAGTDRMREDIVAAMIEVFKPDAIVERSDQPSRREEGLEPVTGVRFGTDPGQVAYMESGLKLLASPMFGQKTGAFFDQKNLRKLLMGCPDKSRVTPLCEGRNVLNLFSYSGATGIAAMVGGAARVHNVDGSEEALALAAKHAELNNIDPNNFSTEKADVFQWLGEERAASYDMVIIDPPALIKAGRDTEEGKKAYHFLNRAAMRLVKPEGIFITSSCSHFLPEEDLAFLLRRASVQSGISLDVLTTVHQSPDHPTSVYFPEAAYLKTFVCRVNR